MLCRSPLFGLLLFIAHGSARLSPADSITSLELSSRPSTNNVPLDLFVMSRCPFAVACEKRIDDVLQVIGDYVDIIPHYIANDVGYPTTCKNGNLECEGNRQQLCVLSKAKIEAYWQFVLCQDKNVTAIGDVAWAETCLNQLDLAFTVASKIKTCYTNSEGDTLLRNSAHRTAQLGVKGSCTVWIDGVEFPEDSPVVSYVDHICSVYKAKSGVLPPGCNVQVASEALVT